MLGEEITNAASGVDGKIEIVPSKTDIKAGDTTYTKVSSFWICFIINSIYEKFLKN